MSPGLRDRTTEKGKPVMSNVEGLRAGIAEMRSVAQRLNQWADDLEASFHEAAEVTASDLVPAEKGKKAEKTNAAESAVSPEKGFTLPEVRAILAEKCASGYGTQIKALIESFGVTSLKGVPAEKYPELLRAVESLGDSDAG